MAGRKRKFVEDDVLAGVMNAFRVHGYGAVTIRQLESAVGLTSGSLYNAYGDKDGIYRAAFTYYLNTFVRPRIAALAEDRATLDDLEAVFLSILQMPFADGHGCLVTNAAIEFGAAPSVASDFVREGFDLLTSGIRKILTRKLGAAAAAVPTARLVALYQGMLVLSRAGRCESVFADVVRCEFDRLKAARGTATASSSRK